MTQPGASIGEFDEKVETISGSGPDQASEHATFGVDDGASADKARRIERNGEHGDLTDVHSPLSAGVNGHTAPAGLA